MGIERGRSAVKDEDSAHPIADSWRPLLQEVVSAFAQQDYSLKRGIAGVLPIDHQVAEQIEHYLADYGEKLVSLPEATWETSCAQWMGDYWDVLVDLWTEGEGASDLVLTGKMEEVNGNPLFSVGLVYVP